MTQALTEIELRVLGVLIEKELTTPDYYPLTTSALVAGCNQKTSRDPIMSLTDQDAQQALDGLIHASLVREKNPAGARVSKYAHRLGDSLGLSYGFKRTELAVLAALMLRGPQTAGELKARTERMRGPNASADIEGVLITLRDHSRGVWTRELEREPGRRETRWVHLFGRSDDAIASDTSEIASSPARSAVPSEVSPGAPALDTEKDLQLRVQTLEAQVAALTHRLDALSADLGLDEP